MLKFCCRILIVFLLCAVTAAEASVHDIHLYTDSKPDYVSIEDFVATATSAWDTPEDQAIAFWRWMVRGRQQISNTFEDGVPIWDPMQFFGSYPNANCGYVASYITAFADEMGGDWRHRYIELGDHTVAELSWDAGATWHMFDTSMVAFARKHDGTIASAADITAASSCALSAFWGDPGAEKGHYYLYHTTPEAMTNPPDPDQKTDLGFGSGYRKASDNPVPYSRTLRNGADSYKSIYQIQEAFTHIRHGWRNRLHLHSGHTYTRFWTPQGSGSEYARLNTKGVDPNDGYVANHIRSNGFWEVAPEFSAADASGGWFALSGIVHRDEDGGTGPTLRPGPGVGQADAAVKVDAANVITSARVYLAGQRGAGDNFRFEYSRDAGCSWSTVTTLPTGSFAGWHTLPSAMVGGASELLVRARMEPDATRLDCGLDDLRLEVTTQVNALTLPNLQRGANRVRFAAGPPQETLTLRPSLHSGAGYPWTDSADSYSGLTSREDPKSYSSAVLVPSFPSASGHATWRIDTPSDLVGATLGGSFITRHDTPNDRVALSYSWDGVNYATPATFDASDAPTYDARLFVSTAQPPTGQRSVWLRYELESTESPSSTSTGIQDALLQIHHEPHDPSFDPVEVTYCWTEHRTSGDVTRQHTRVVTTTEETWDLNVGGYRDPTMEWLRVRLAEVGAPEGYDDGMDVGPGAGYDKVKIEAEWLDDLALGRPYIVSRPADSTNPDSGGSELTDGVIIPPTDFATSSLVQGQAAYWDGDDPLVVTVDLGSVQTVRAIRVTSHQPNDQFGHAGTIAVSGLDAGSNPTALGVIQHDDIWSPPGDHLDWGYGRTENFPDLPAGGRMAYGYWLVLDDPVTAEQIRLDILPLAGHGVGLSEIQVFSAVNVSDWPDREVPLGSGPVSYAPDTVPLASVNPRLTVAPNPANPGSHIRYELPRGTEVVLRIIDVRGRLVRTLVDGWKPGGSHRAYWDGRDDGGRAMASGVYLAIADWKDGRATGSITLVK